MSGSMTATIPGAQNATGAVDTVFTTAPPALPDPPEDSYDLDDIYDADGSRVPRYLDEDELYDDLPPMSRIDALEWELWAAADQDEAERTMLRLKAPAWVSLPPGAALAAELETLRPPCESPIALIEAMKAAARMEAWAASIKAAAMASFWRQRKAQATELPRPTHTDSRGRPIDPERSWEAEIAAALKLAPPTAARHIDTALHLTSTLTATHTALRCGALTWSKALAISEATRALPPAAAQAVETHVLRRAPSQTHRNLQTSLRRQVAKHTTQDDTNRHREALADRTCKIVPLPDGMAGLWIVHTADKIQQIWITIQAMSDLAKRRTPTPQTTTTQTTTTQPTTNTSDTSDTSDASDTAATPGTAPPAHLEATTPGTDTSTGTTTGTGTTSSAGTGTPTAADAGNTVTDTPAADAAASTSTCSVTETSTNTNTCVGAGTQTAAGTDAGDDADTPTITAGSTASTAGSAGTAGTGTPTATDSPANGTADETTNQRIKDGRTAEQRRADVMADLFEHMLHNGLDWLGRRLPDQHRRRPHIEVLIPITTLLDIDNDPCELTGYGPIPAHMARRIATNGTWRRLLTDPTNGTVLEASTTRHDPGTLVTETLLARHPTCAWPGCNRTSRQCDRDHGTPFTQSGQTTLTGLAPLCEYHHVIKDTPAWGWTTTNHPDGSLTLTTPTGHRYTTVPPARGPIAPTPTRQPQDDPPPY